MVKVYFASVRENSETGWALSMHLRGDRVYDDGIFEYPNDDIVKSGVLKMSKAGDVLLSALSRIPKRERVRLHVLKDERFFRVEGVSHQDLNDFAEAHDFASIEIKEVEESLEEYTVGEALHHTKKAARAECWGVKLNHYNYVPGDRISTKKAQSLHITASKNGWNDGAVRLLLSERGMISMKEVTDAIYNSISRLLGSEVLAKKYNQEYDELNRAVVAQ